MGPRLFVLVVLFVLLVLVVAIGCLIDLHLKRKGGVVNNEWDTHPDERNKPEKCRWCERSAKIALMKLDRWHCTDCGATYVRKYRDERNQK